jgi:peptidylprolyl isomerase
MNIYKILVIVLIIIGAVLLWFSLFAGEDSAENNVMQAKITTNKGEFTVELYKEKMPITTGNFTKLAKDGVFNETKFHRIIPGFIIQGGDPNSRSDNKASYGRGGPGYTIEDEFHPELSNTIGTLSMANTGLPNSGGSQFFINLTDNVGLDFNKEPATSRHPVFGKVIEGMEVIDEMAKTETDELDIPLDPIIIQSIEIVE